MDNKVVINGLYNVKKKRRGNQCALNVKKWRVNQELYNVKKSVGVIRELYNEKVKGL